jgi:hypothetical protein
MSRVASADDCAPWSRYLLLGPTRKRKPHRVRDMRVSFLFDKWPVSRRAGFATWSFVSAFESVHPTMRFGCLLARVHARGIQVLSVEHELRARPRCNHTRGPGNAPSYADAFFKSGAATCWTHPSPSSRRCGSCLLFQDVVANVIVMPVWLALCGTWPCLLHISTSADIQ